MISIATIRQVLALHDAERLPDPETVWSRASVAMILSGDEGELSLCFILRATRENDRWSGQMAFPGGRASGDDPTARSVAERETFEEVGMQLVADHHVGTLSEISLHRGGDPTGGVLSPFVFYVGSDTPPLTPNEEVEETYWIPLRHLWTPEHATTFDFSYKGETRTFPGIKFADQIIWGLTLRVLRTFAELLERPLPL